MFSQSYNQGKIVGTPDTIYYNYPFMLTTEIEMVCIVQ